LNILWSNIETARLHDTALAFTGLVGLGQESCPSGSLKDLADTLAGTSGTFQVLVGTNLLSDLLTLEVVNIYSYRDPAKLVSDIHTWSKVTGLWEVLFNSSIVFWSSRRSTLHPTKMIGSPWQK
jgi:hypothetical protein